MSKTKTKYAVERKDADAKLIEQVAQVLGMVAKNRYSTSAIYAAHNAVMGLKETPESCTSCLVSRAKTLREWYDTKFDKQKIRAIVMDATAGAAGRVEKPAPVKETPAAAKPKQDDAFDLKAYMEQVGTEAGLGDDSTRDDIIAGLELLLDGEHPEAAREHMQAMYDELVANRDDADPNAPAYEAPAEGVTRYPRAADEVPFDYTPSADDALKGTIKGADGSNVKAGTYTMADGTTIAVSVGGKASIKDDVI